MEKVVLGKNAIITGARSGIGKAIVEHFAEQGANVWACLREPDKEFSSFVVNLEQRYNVWIKPVYMDLMDVESVKGGFKLITMEKKPIDILVNNAGRLHGAVLQMTTSKDMQDIFQINFFSPLLLIQLVSRSMTRQKKGAIVNIVSVAGLDGAEGYFAYGASKAALAFATKTASRELSPYGIRVNAVAPGMIKTHMMELLGTKAKENMIEHADMRRPGEPSEVAEAVVYLASEKSSFITGQILRVDGGL